jgi:hypothetical protein
MQGQRGSDGVVPAIRNWVIWVLPGGQQCAQLAGARIGWLAARAWARLGMLAGRAGRQSPARRGRGMAVVRRRCGVLGCGQPQRGVIHGVRVAPG